MAATLVARLLRYAAEFSESCDRRATEPALIQMCSASTISGRLSQRLERLRDAARKQMVACEASKENVRSAANCGGGRKRDSKAILAAHDESEYATFGRNSQELQSCNVSETDTRGKLTCTYNPSRNAAAGENARSRYSGRIVRVRSTAAAHGGSSRCNSKPAAESQEIRTWRKRVEVCRGRRLAERKVACENCDPNSSLEGEMKRLRLQLEQEKHRQNTLLLKKMALQKEIIDMSILS